MKHITFLKATSASYSSCFQNESASSSSSTTDAGQQRCRKHSFENQSVTMHNFSGKFAQSAPKSLLKEWRIWTQLQRTKMFLPWMILNTWRRKPFFQLWLSQVGGLVLFVVIGNLKITFFIQLEDTEKRRGRKTRLWKIQKTKKSNPKSQRTKRIPNGKNVKQPKLWQ